ncbi:MAG TPA: glutamate--tRNA ligase, partial [Candidatus Krumholzibacteria bacterium]|nr:glutamate--tRNA ligase [Candidatus Krumholzibacteria bacterium]
EASYAAILRGLGWLGLEWDEGPRKGGACGPYLQSERLDIYRAHLIKLATEGKAYRCFCSAEDLQAREQAVRDAGGNWEGYDGRCRHLAEEEIRAFEAEDRPFAWRLKTPAEGTTFWYDVVLGKLEFQNAVLVDRVIVKTDGFPTYQFACVVDDHLMGITHVLRGDDHVSNTPFQILIYQAFGWDLPKFGHMPMILGPDRKRLSKRHGATSVEEFQHQGVIPEAMVNYLALLGWSPGGSGDEVMLRGAIAQKFSLKKVNSSPAAFDYDKLAHINSEHIKRLPADARLDLARPVIAAQGWSFDPAWHVAGAADADAFLARVLAVLGNRFSSLVTLPEQIGFFYAEDHWVDEPVRAEVLSGDEARARLAALADAIETELGLHAPHTAAEFEAVLRAQAERLGVGAGDLIHPARVALTGQGRSAGMFDVMELVGAPRTVARLRRAATAA